VAVACLSAAVSLLLLAALFMQIPGVILTLTWPRSLCLLRVLCMMPLLQAFHLPSTLREVTLHQLSQTGKFIYSSHGKWVFPSLLWSFPPIATFTSFPAPGCWVFAAAPAFSSLLVYLQFCEGLPLPLSLALRAPHHLCYMSFWLLFFIISFFFFFFLFTLDGGWSVQGAMLIWPRVVYGSTAYRLAHLVVCIFPSRLGTGVWLWHGSPPGFSI
jgi:hypothetical protein